MPAATVSMGISDPACIASQAEFPHKDRIGFMSDTIISVEQLGKSYRIDHRVERAPYKTLRETITQKTKNLFGGRHSHSGRSAREEFWALRDVSFDVKQGEVVGIVGRNGAGKSTLLKVLSRITEPTHGRVRIRGRVASLLEVGTGFHPELTGRENVFLNGAILGMSKGEIQRKFDEIIDFAGTEKFLDTPVKRYSSGMYVRLAFAVAAHLEPEILIVDEVLAVGDVQFQKKCLGKMHDVSVGGRTVIFVSHNMAAVLQLTSRSLLLKQGQIAFDGRTEEAIAIYTETAGEFSNTVFDVDDVPRKELGTGAIRIVSLWFDRSAPRFEANEDLEFSLRVRAAEDVRGLRVSMTLFSANGMAVGSAFSPESITLAQGLTCDVIIRLPDPRMAPGRYYCSVGIGKGDHTSGHTLLDGAWDVLHFEVMPEMGEAGTLSLWASDWGHLRFHTLDVSFSALPQEIEK
jgi:lipopolysaccharide transport system ATP-binding protein